MTLIIGGDSDVSLRTEPVCSHMAKSVGDTLLSWILKPRLGTLRKLLYVGYPKGARSLAGATVYVARINWSGQWRMAKPCDRCVDQLASLGAKYVVYTTNKGTWMRGRL